MTVVRGYLHGSTVRLPDYNGEVPPGSFFRAWNTRPNGTGAEYKAGETVMMCDDLHLYPTFYSMTREEIEGMRDMLIRMLEGMEGTPRESSSRRDRA